MRKQFNKKDNIAKYEKALRKNLQKRKKLVSKDQKKEVRVILLHSGKKTIHSIVNRNYIH